MKQFKSLAAAFCLASAALGGSAMAQAAPSPETPAADARAVQAAANTCRTYQEVYGRDCSADQRANLVRIYNETLNLPAPVTDAEGRSRVANLINGIAGILGIPAAEVTNPPVTPEAVERHNVNLARGEVDTICTAFAQQAGGTCTQAQRDQLLVIVRDEMKRPAAASQEELEARTLALVNNVRRVLGLPPIQLEQQAPASPSSVRISPRYTA